MAKVFLKESLMDKGKFYKGPGEHQMEDDDAKRLQDDPVTKALFISSTDYVALLEAAGLAEAGDEEEAEEAPKKAAKKK